MGPRWLEAPARWAGMPWYDRVVALNLIKGLPTRKSLAPLEEFEHLHSLTVVTWEHDEAHLQAYAAARGIELASRKILLDRADQPESSAGGEVAEQTEAAPSFTCPSGRELAHCSSSLPQLEMK